MSSSLKRVVLQHTELRDLKEKVRQRDGNKCRCCKSRKMLACHHVIFKSDIVIDTAENLVTLCVDCHRSVHGLVAKRFIVIVDPESDLFVPNANKGLKFKTYNKVGRRVRWRL